MYSKDSPTSALEKFAIEFLVSGVSASISKTIASPIEVIKIRLQLQQALLQKKTLLNPYLGIADCFKRLYQQEGLPAYYKGNLINVIRYFPTQALNFAFKDYYKRQFSTLNKHSSFWDTLLINVFCGSIAGASTQFFVYPLDYIRTRLTNDILMAKTGGATRQFNGIIDCAYKTYEWDGLRGLYRGFVCSCMMMIVYRGFYFGLNDSIKPRISREIQQNMFYNFCIGYAITISAGTLSYPLDTIRRRMMMSSGQQYRFTSARQCATHLYRQHGMRSFFGGVGANMLRAVTGAGVLTIYDKFQLILFGKRYSTGEGGG